MCGSSPKIPVDNSAQIARKAEADRQARIAQGRSAIDSSFSNFNDNFYNTHQKTYSDYYTPQLDDQYDDARKRLTLQLAKTGNLTSSAGINQMGDLKEYYNTQRTGVQNKAINATNELRSSVDNRLSQLYSDNLNAADPGSATTAATSAAQALQPQAPSSPLANTFADFFSNLGNAVAVANTNGRQQQTGVQNFNNGGSGSYKVYGNR